jgi:hypothetical protein
VEPGKNRLQVQLQLYKKPDENSGSNGLNPVSDSNSINTGSDSNSINPVSDSNSTNSGSDSSSTDHGDSSRISSGSTPSVKNKIISTSEVERSDTGIVNIPGITDIQPKIKENVVQASIIKTPSRTLSFLIGFAGTLFIVFTVMRVRMKLQ